MRAKTVAGAAIAAQLSAIVLWSLLNAPGPILGTLLATQALFLFALAASLFAGWRRAPFAVALSALFPFTVAVGELLADPGARLPAALLASASLAAVLALGLTSRRG